MDPGRVLSNAILDSTVCQFSHQPTPGLFGLVLASFKGQRLYAYSLAIREIIECVLLSMVLYVCSHACNKGDFLMSDRAERDKRLQNSV